MGLVGLVIAGIVSLSGVGRGLSEIVSNSLCPADIVNEPKIDFPLESDMPINVTTIEVQKGSISKRIDGKRRYRKNTRMAQGYEIKKELNGRIFFQGIR